MNKRRMPIVMVFALILLMAAPAAAETKAQRQGQSSELLQAMRAPERTQP